MAVKLDGKKLSQKIAVQLQQDVEKLKFLGVTPKLAVVLVGDDPASQVYVRNKRRMAQKIGIETSDLTLPAATSEAELLQIIAKLNQDSTVHGILVQLPLPPQINEETIIQAINPLKDVDGFHPYNMGKLFMGDPYAIPCTPNGIMQLLSEYRISLTGKKVVIVGRSKIVGRPLAALMINHNATVTVAHSYTKNLFELTRRADILVAAVGRAEMFTQTAIESGAVVVDVGINRNDAGKLVGDVDQMKVADVASYLTPVPGGVGPMTIAMLMKQTVKFAERSVKGIGND
ncbi:bifunctional methylenetetrahydrofolate dehydrogenase/methenyltetrahydrofolate cyclohydrolase FolD [Liquorilactobacillus nagelii]|uniref:bifunctional methylenetetrahydrofolate dehydrogenase/methenyltetrahydrofolate cyclohydrolase FolD n=1 Tax=Liquorilactobacillus nagelii TaxID=82688 RepID=UPI00070DF800|nr:bifunctional methylenetetrahydrofolate dehydrogenase/methenyltetrahydrofolate cyclohydrolase FolD [Liquorilactobacillus nagelii]QYH53777.1 bifunctional methylenetetrahydrofolate dehydrogenase/methenyltetrahydrofolate cyclohydrolase FolD [Liquorilactobacillus nagelii DSM 13675]